MQILIYRNGESCQGSEDDCLFIPHATQTAKTSLMHLHFIESVVEFCDEATHNKESLNRQNAYCGHKSTMEVIRSTSDWEAVKEPKDEIPTIEFSTSKGTPYFYLLLDRGSFKPEVLRFSFHFLCIHKQ